MNEKSGTDGGRDNSGAGKTKSSEVSGKLCGMRIVLCRPASRAVEWKKSLEKAGASVISAPVIKILPPDSYEEIDRAILKLSEANYYDWAVFTSINSVEAVFLRMEKLGINKKLFPSCKFAAVGKATARALENFGFSDIRLPERQDASGLLESFSDEDLKGKRILMPRSDIGRDTFPVGAALRGAEVDVVTAYRTVMDQEGAEKLRNILIDKEADALFAGSPSQVEAVKKILGPDLHLLSDCFFVCAGETTFRAALKEGIEARVCGKPEPQELVKLLSGLCI